VGILAWVVSVLCCLKPSSVATVENRFGWLLERRWGFRLASALSMECSLQMIQARNKPKSEFPVWLCLENSRCAEDTEKRYPQSRHTIHILSCVFSVNFHVVVTGVTAPSCTRSRIMPMLTELRLYRLLNNPRGAALKATGYSTTNKSLLMLTLL